MKLASRLIAIALFSAITACAPMNAEPAMAPAPIPAPAPASGQGTAEARTPVTILISIDGFRPDYLRKGDTPVLDALAAAGAEGPMRPSFPSLTFPNHTAIVTGLRPDRNGIVSNTMYDARRPEARFSLGDAKEATDPFWWDESEPIWITAEKQGIHSSLMFWPGGEVSHEGVRAFDWSRYDANFSGDQRVRAALDWMRRPAAIRPRFMTLYFDTVDKHGHKEGPFSPETREAIRAVDGQIGVLRDGLAALGQQANLVILSDHGMAEIGPDRLITLDKILPRDLYRIAVQGPHAGIDPLPGKEAAVEKALLAPRDHVRCWRKQDLPERFHYGKNPRVPAIFCLADMGWELLQAPPATWSKGDHGFDPDAPDMAALLILNGPAFVPGAAMPARIDNVDVYPLLARLIGVSPLPGDGDPAILDGMLVAP
ncbi:ectonucleotide pyrophosphatase/phosphodiesterase [soil metagenome]